jgi:hypothetical protein
VRNRRHPAARAGSTRCAAVDSLTPHAAASCA